MQAKLRLPSVASLLAPPHAGTPVPTAEGARPPAWFAGAAALLIAARLGLAAVLAPGDVAEAMCRWDCHWYVIVAEHGYDPVLRLMRGHWQPDWAFFPLLPGLMRGVSILTGVSPKAAGLAVSALALWAFVLAGHAYRRRTRPRAQAWPWLLVVMAWPYGVYFQAPYTESLFAALTCLCLLGATDARPWLSALSCALLTATRPNAVLMAGWLGMRCLYLASQAAGARARLAALAPAIAAPAGLIAFMVLLWARLGDPLAFIHAQGAWGHALRNPAAVLADAVRGAGTGRAHLGLLYHAGWAIVGLGVAGAALLRGRRFEAWLCAGTVGLALLSGTLWSMPRYVACNPVVLLLAGDAVETIESSMVRNCVLLAGSCVQVVLTLEWYREAAFLV